MKFVIALSVLFSSFSAFAALPELCAKEASEAVHKYYSDGYFGQLLSAQVAEYTATTSFSGEPIVKYEYNTKTSKGDSYARLYLAIKDCEYLGGDSYASKEEMLLDDSEWSQGSK